MEPKLSRQAKDHVFVDMFNQPKYCLALFNALHPEATDITEADIRESPGTVLFDSGTSPKGLCRQL